MKNKFLVVSIILSLVALCGCGQSPGEKSPVVAKINKYLMTENDIKEYINSSPYYSPEDLEDLEARKELLEEIIQKEVLLQEAQQLDLDKEKSFMRVIELYWEQALIKSLLDKKTKELMQKIEINENEISEYYSKLKEVEEDIPSLSEMRKDIIEFLQMQKESLALDKWVLGLRNSANITVDEKALENLKFSDE